MRGVQSSSFAYGEAGGRGTHRVAPNLLLAARLALFSVYRADSPLTWSINSYWKMGLFRKYVFPGQCHSVALAQVDWRF
jgi:hypothetical protein